jgi:hypothetical protein
MPFSAYVSLLITAVWVSCLALPVWGDVNMNGGRLLQFEGPCPVPAHPSANVQSDFDLAKEHFWLYVPKGYDGKSPYGLIVYDSPGAQQLGLPAGWGPVLDADKLIFIAPQNAGNDQKRPRREGLFVVAEMEMAKKYAIDPARVYASGFSKGGATASDVAFHHSDLFRATIQCCETDFYKPLPFVERVPADFVQHPEPYGSIVCTPEQVAAAKKSVKFEITTGTNDFRLHFVDDIFKGGFQPEGFYAKLWFVPGTTHQPCRPETLRAVLADIEGAKGR